MKFLQAGIERTRANLFAMSVSTEAQRTLVKSPPELWAELSDPEALGRHLGKLGAIKITEANPEQSIEWEAEDATGTVELKPSGWGTKVRLTVTRDLPPVAAAEEADTGAASAETGTAVEDPAAEEPAADVETATGAAHADPAPETAAAEPASSEQDETAPAHDEAAPGPDGATLQQADAAPGPDGATPEPAISARQEDATAAPEADSAREEQAAEPTPARRLGFFARLFRRHRRSPSSSAAEPPPAAVEDQASEEISAEEATSSAAQNAEPADQAPAPADEIPIESDAAPDAADEVPHTPGDAADAGAPDEIPDLAAELAAAEEAIAAETTEILTAVLDRLGQAHHRPFSRA